MRKVIVNYDESTNSLMALNGNNLWGGPTPDMYEEIDSKSSKNNIDDIVKLKNAGYSIQDIAELKSLGLL